MTQNDLIRQIAKALNSDKESELVKTLGMPEHKMPNGYALLRTVTRSGSMYYWIHHTSQQGGYSSNPWETLADCINHIGKQDKDLPC